MSFAQSLFACLATPIILFQLMKLVLARSRTRRAVPAPCVIRTAAAALAMTVFCVTFSAAQETSVDPDTQPAVSESAALSAVSPAESVIIGPNDIMGFEYLGTWGVTTNSVVPGFAVQSTTVRTQGRAAYAVNNPPTLIKLISRPIAYTATALAGIGDRGALLQLDVQIPCENQMSTRNEQGDCIPANTGWIEGFVSSKSRGLNHVSLDKVSFCKYRAGIYNTISFSVPESVSSALDNQEFTDLVFEFDVSSPTDVDGAFLFDNLRVHSVELVQSPKGIAPPAGYGGSVDLTVTGNKPVKQTFSLDPIQIPGGLHLKLGKAGTTTLQLEAGLDSGTTFTCMYLPDSNDESGQSYIFKSCTGTYAAGDIVNSNWISLGINGGEMSQQVYAQVALRPLGDLTGAGLLPPMPTFWGSADSCSPAPVAGKVVTRSTSCSSQTAQANSIITNYFNQVTSAHPSPSWIVAPVPESATRRADGTPTSHLSSAAAADAAPNASNDLPFDTGGDLNPGGSFDAYWKLSGNLTPTAVAGTDENLTHFDAAFTAHGVLFGDDVDVVDAQLTADTDSGETTPTYKPATSSGTLGFYVFGEEIPSGGLTFTPSTGFSVDPSWNQEYDLPSIQIWIFDITLGALVDADLKVSGSAALSGLDLSVTPSASLGAHISGGIDLDIAQGDVDAKVNLITLSAPATAQAKWVLNDDPSICAAELDGSLDGNLNVSSGGGEVDLDATFGICPFCFTDSWTLFKWGALANQSWNLFSDTIDTQLFGLPASMCKYSINAKIVSPPAGASVSSGLPITLTGSAAPTESTLAYTSTYTWTFTPGANAAGTVTVVGANSANPSVTFPAPTSGNTSTWTIHMTATTTVRSAGGAVLTETASAAPVTITVTPLSPGDHFSVSTEYNPVTTSGGVVNVGNAPGTITFSGLVVDAPGTPNTTFTVAPCTYINFGNRSTCIVTIGQTTVTTLPTVGANTATPSASWTGFEGGYYWVTMTTTVGNSTFSTVSAIIYGTEIL
jgi:hypothetical protein